MQKPKYEVGALVKFYTGIDFSIKEWIGIVTEVRPYLMDKTLYIIYGQIQQKYYHKLEAEIDNCE